MVPNLASSSLENLSLENLPRGEFKLFFALLAKNTLDIVCSSLESNTADIFFADASQVLIMFWHDFGRGGGARAIVMFFVGGAEGVVSIFSWYDT